MENIQIDKDLYDSLNANISASLNFIKALEKEVKGLNKTIEKVVKRIDNHQFQCLISIPDIDHVFHQE